MEGESGVEVGVVTPRVGVVIQKVGMVADKVWVWSFV